MATKGLLEQRTLLSPLPESLPRIAFYDVPAGLSAVRRCPRSDSIRRGSVAYSCVHCKRCFYRVNYPAARGPMLILQGCFAQIKVWEHPLHPCRLIH
uniref:Uncharacterized protein n=1 Tax=Anguilla anguilla TaxID=7936 RepID=A0A0E9WLQ3_ANGAN